jgi:hypothetical protein
MMRLSPFFRYIKSNNSKTKKLKQQWTIEEISIFSNSSHLEWRAELSDTILKGTQPGTIPARLGFLMNFWYNVLEHKFGVPLPALHTQ